MLRLIDDFYKN